MSVRKLKEQVAGHENVLRQLVNEVQSLKDFCIGTLEVVKLLPDYENALQKLKDDYEKDKPPKLELEDEK
tara:strand:+ start:269 stop:478 length:210 start_codon:yes stop_codon:yes gene_type:complete